METKLRPPEVQQEKKRGRAARLFGLCPRRHILLAAGILLLAFYFIFRENASVTEFWCDNVAMPYHRGMGTVFSLLPFSFAEICYAAAIAGALVYIIYTIWRLIRCGNRLARAYKFLITLLSAGLAIYAGVCLLWGFMYYGPDFSDRSGIAAEPVSAHELYVVTSYFAGLANEMAEAAEFDGEMDYFIYSGEVFDEAVKEFPFLDGPSLKPKKMIFSYIMSYINFTGVFFPFTGEANVNTHSPEFLIPATIAHEMAHQRGIAKEEEANFVAVLAATRSDDPRFVYSGAMLAYIHLGNALYKADYSLWEEVYGSLDEKPREDLRENSWYWAQFKTQAAEASTSVYSSFLQSQGQQSGIKSYGECVDLLVAYYLSVN